MILQWVVEAIAFSITLLRKIIDYPIQLPAFQTCISIPWGVFRHTDSFSPISVQLKAEYPGSRTQKAEFNKVLKEFS